MQKNLRFFDDMLKGFVFYTRWGLFCVLGLAFIPDGDYYDMIMKSIFSGIFHETHKEVMAGTAPTIWWNF